MFGLCVFVSQLTFSALALLIGQQEGHDTSSRKNCHQNMVELNKEKELSGLTLK